MESIDMDISGSEEEDDDEVELTHLLGSLNGLEKCLLPIDPKSGVEIMKQEKMKNVNTSKSNERNNNEALHPNRAVVSPTDSDASTLSRGSTPGKQIFHCLEDCDNNHTQKTKQVTIAQLLDNDSDNDVILDHINEYRKNLENESANTSDSSDITCLDLRAEIIYSEAKSKEAVLCTSSETYPSINVPIPLDDIVSSPRNLLSEVEPSAIISIEPQSNANERNAYEKDDSDSDCLIVEHIAASDHRQNGLIDLTKPTSDEEASLPLQERTEESLLKEISKIRKALMKNPKKKRRKEKRKHHKSLKKKKRSKSKSQKKSPSLEKVSDSECDNEKETRTIMLSECGELSVNIITERSLTNSASSDGSKISESKSERNVKEKFPEAVKVSETSNNEVPVSEKLKCENISSIESDPKCNKLLKGTGSTNHTKTAENSNLWKSDDENGENNETTNQVTEPNPLKRKLFSHDSPNSNKTKKKVFCESGKELNSMFRRKTGPTNTSHDKRKSTFGKNSKFNRYSSNSDDSSSCNRKSRSRRADKFSRFTSHSDSDKSSGSSICRKPRKIVDSDEDKINCSRVKSPTYSIAETDVRSGVGEMRRTSSVSYNQSYDKHRRSRSRSYYRSPNRSPSCYRRFSPSSCRSPSPSSSFRRKLHSRRSKSRHKTSSKASVYQYKKSISRSSSSDYRSSYRSKSRTFRSPSRSRRSRSRTYRSPSRLRRSPSRSRRSESRTYQSPSRYRRSKSRTYRSPSRSRRTKSHPKSPRRRSDSRSPSEIRAARKWSPLEDMRQQLRKNNEAAVQQALGSLEKPVKTAANMKACAPRLIDDVDLTKSSPSPDLCAESRTLHNNAPPDYRNIIGMPMSVPVAHVPGVLNQTSVLQISQVYSQAIRPLENYLPLYPQPHPPYM